MSASEFSGRLFVAGSVTAIRVFKVDSLGRLCSPTQEFVFRPGVNEAECGLVLDPFRSARLSARMAKAGVTLEKPAHRPGSMGCSCGFYAYYTTGANPWHGDGTVEAIVEATGVVCHGTKGIRAERLEVAGIIMRPTGSGFGQFARWLSVGDKDDWAGGISLTGGVVTLIGAAILSATVSLWFLAMLVLPAACTVVFAAAVKAIEYYPNGTGSPKGHVPQELVDAVRRNYPRVPVYPSRKAALRVHRLTQPPTPVGPSPDDEDFWTRRAV